MTKAPLANDAAEFAWPKAAFACTNDALAVFETALKSNVTPPELVTVNDPFVLPKITPSILIDPGPTYKDRQGIEGEPK